MTNSNSTSWKRTFVGRERELEQILDAFRQVSPRSFDTHRTEPGIGATLVLIEAQSGVGKSRLVQEFYRRIADSSPDAAHALDPDDYWPDAFGDPDLVGKIVNPVFETGVRRKSPPPFLWWGVRWPEPATEQASVAELAMTNPGHLDALVVHWDACRQRVGRSVRDAITAGRIAASFVLPRIFTSELMDIILEGVDAAEDGVEAGKGVRASVRDWRLRWKGRDAGEAFRDLENSRIRRLEKVLRAILDPAGLGPIRDAATPMILWLDDAQWMTPEEIELLRRLLTVGADRRWPLLVIATAWPADSAAQRDPWLIHTLARERRETARDRFVHIELRDDLESIDLRPVIAEALPGATSGQIDAIASKAPGHPLLLRLILEDILSSPTNFTDSNVSGPVADACIAELSTMTVAAARDTFIRRKLARLDRQVRRVLEIGSVQGTEFAREVTLRAAEARGIDRSTSHAALIDSAAELALVDAGDEDPSLQFRQPAYREILHAELPNEDRLGIHELVRRTIVEEIEKAHLDDRDPPALVLELAMAHLRLTEGETAASEEGRAKILAIVALMRALGKEGRRSRSLELARELVSTDHDRENGVPLELLGPAELQNALRVLAAGAPDEFASFAERVRPRLRHAGPHQATSASQTLDFIAESLQSRVDRLRSMAAIRGAEAGLADKDPLTSRLSLQENPEHHRGPEHWILSDLAAPRSIESRPGTGGNPYRLRAIPGTNSAIVVFDNHVELVDRTGRSAPQVLETAMVDPPRFGMRVAVSHPMDGGRQWWVTIGCGAYADHEGTAPCPLVLLRCLRRDSTTGEFQLESVSSFDSAGWGESCFTSDNRLAMVGPTGDLELRTESDWESPVVIPCPPGPPQCLSVHSPDTIAVGAQGGIGLINLSTGAWQPVSCPRFARVTAMATAGATRLLVAGDHSVHAVDTGDGAMVWTRRMRAAVWDIAVSPDDERLAVLGGDAMVHLLDSEGRDLVEPMGDADGITWSASWDAEGLVYSAEGGGVRSLPPDAVESLIRSGGGSNVRNRRHQSVIAISRRCELTGESDGSIRVRAFDGTTRDLDPISADSRWVLPAHSSDEYWCGPIEWNESTGRAYIHTPDGSPPSALPLPANMHAWWPVPGRRMAVGFNGNGEPIRLEWNDVGALQTFDFETDEGVLRTGFTTCSLDILGRPVLGMLDGRVFRWNNRSPDLLFRASGWIQALHEVDDDLWLSGNHNGRVELIAEGTCMWRCDLRRSYVADLLALPDRDRCFALMRNGDLHVLSLGSGERLCGLPLKIDSPRRIVHDPVGDALVLIDATGRRAFPLSDPARNAGADAGGISER